jgi:hypothetical protein
LVFAVGCCGPEAQQHGSVVLILGWLRVDRGWVFTGGSDKFLDRQITIYAECKDLLSSIPFRETIHFASFAGTSHICETKANIVQAGVASQT